MQYGCDFNTLDIHGCRDFCETLYAQVYPEHPDFSAWDASDAAELAAMQQEVAADFLPFSLLQTLVWAQCALLPACCISFLVARNGHDRNWIESCSSDEWYRRLADGVCRKQP